MPTSFREAEGHNMGDDKRKPHMNPAQSETPGMPGNSMRENRETPQASGSSTPDRLEKATSYTTSPLFERFAGTTRSSDSPLACMLVV